ncbi:MAG TPA: hypothetical protein VFU49_23080 [Ktedonobacteraceae bacterium]|nr:hypothetical protein [Ktedonobacteraceae bacterium]
MYIHWKNLRISRYSIVALLLISFAFALRLLLMAHGWPETTSEEGTFGLEAMHIAYRGQFPIFMYGQNYMGTLEAYLGAVYFHLFGISIFSLRLSTLTLFTLFLFALYSLTTLLYSPPLALLTLMVLSVGTPLILTPEMIVVGGTTETLLFGTLLLLLATRLSLTSRQELSARHKRLRLIGFAAWGCCVGLGLWSHLLVVPFVLVSGLLLLIFCRKEVCTLAPIALLLGLLCGSLPLIIHNIKANEAQNSITAFLLAYNFGSPARIDTHFVLQQLSGTFLYSLPVATGLNPVCDVRLMPFFNAAPSPVGCLLAQGGWSLGYLLLFITAFGIICRRLLKLSKFRAAGVRAWSMAERQQAVLYTAQLMLLFSVVITVALFAHSSIAAVRPWSTRYLIGLLIATPALLWPLWNGVRCTSAAGWSGWRRVRLLTLARWTLLALLIGLFATETLSTTADMPTIRADTAQVNIVTQKLIQMGITHIYSGYWQCDRFIFQTQEKLICAVLMEDLSPGLTRYARYSMIVHADPNAAYVFPQDSPYATNFEREMIRPYRHFQKIAIDGYVIYQPCTC